jgi:methyl-accepting chemotaxis protein
MADAMGAALAPHLDEMDVDAVRRTVRAARESGLYQALALVGRNGRVLASEPPLPEDLNPAEHAPCAECHLSRRPLPHASLESATAETRVVQIFRSLERRPACVRCHGPGEDPLGYLYLEIPAAGASPPLWTEAVLHAGVGIAAVLVFLSILHWLLSVRVVRPLDRICEEAERIAAGEATPSVEVEGPEEFWPVCSALENVGRRFGDVRAEVSSLASHLKERNVEVPVALARLKEGARMGQGAAEAIFQSVGQLNGTVEQTRSNLDSIATSTSDNSTSLIEMSASIDQVAGSADQLAQYVADTASAVFQMVQSIGEVTDRVEVLARETDATASSMAQIDSSTRQIEENAREAADLSGRMAETAREGSRAVQETLRGIDASHEVIQETTRAMDGLSDASKAIEGVVKIINDINDKTKLLALNAAIIAAQAGEHGKSFAVVAHEIKNLSDRTASSTGEISRITRGILERVEVASETAARGEGAAARGVDLAEGAGKTLERILATAQKSHDMTRGIVAATEEQSRGSQSVMASMQEVSAMVTYIRQAAQEHRGSGEQVSESTEIMRDLTEQVKLATAEQAEVSRYISEAIATIDRNLQTLVETVDQEGEETEKILQHLNHLKERSAGQDEGVRAVESVIGELQGLIDGLRTQAVDLVDRGERGP